MNLSDSFPAGLAAILVLSGVASLAAEPEPDPSELPRIPGKSLEEAAASFELREGFRIELAAGEPEVVDPVAIAFDEAGRMFVAEMRGYPERREEALGRIKRLEDTDGDGCYETATIFADGLKWPTGVVCWKGGVFVTASPDILYFGDEDGDGVAEERRVAFTGFGAGRDRLNMQALVNNLQWGPDGRIYGSTAANGGVVKANKEGAEPVNLRGSDFSFDPETLELRKESGTAQYGLTFDDYGRRYLCSNSRHLIAVMYSWPWNEVPGLPNPLVDIPVDGGAAEVFRISEVEPWRVVRTRWRVQGKVGGPIEGGGRASGYFTSASGLTVYRGVVFPEEFRGNVFVGDVGSNLVHRKVIEFPENRVQPVARRAEGEEKREFLASTDNWFRPVQCANGPDGALYVVDMYRETIEHPWSLPESIKKHLDLYSGNDRGRIWRVVPEGWERPEAVDRSALSTEQLVELLKRGNGWESDTISRLLLEREDWEVLDPALLKLGANGSVEDWVRANALRLYSRHLALNGWYAAIRKKAESAEVRREMARLSEPIHSKGLRRDLKDPDPRVRFELVLRMLAPEVELSLEPLTAAVASAAGDPWILRTAAVAARRHGVLKELVKEQEDLAVAVAILKSAGGAEAEGAAALLVERARKILGDEKVPVAAREAAVWVIGRDAATKPEELHELVLDPEPSVAEAAAAALRERPAAQWEAEVLARWQEIRAGMRGGLLTKMSATTVLDAIEAGSLRKEEVGFQQQQRLRNDRDEDVRKRAVELLGEEEVRSREEAAAHYREALLLDGDGKNGAEIFAQRCAVCHREDAGGAGPALATLRNKGAPMLLENLIAPDREVAPQYFLWEVARKDGLALAGMIASEEAEGVTLRLADGTERRVARDDIAKLTNLNRSLMPPGLEAGLSLQQMADLLAFLTRKTAQ